MSKDNRQTVTISDDNVQILKEYIDQRGGNMSSAISELVSNSLDQWLLKQKEIGRDIFSNISKEKLNHKFRNEIPRNSSIVGYLSKLINDIVFYKNIHGLSIINELVDSILNPFDFSESTNKKYYEFLLHKIQKTYSFKAYKDNLKEEFKSVQDWNKINKLINETDNTEVVEDTKITDYELLINWQKNHLYKYTKDELFYNSIVISDLIAINNLNLLDNDNYIIGNNCKDIKEKTISYLKKYKEKSKIIIIGQTGVGKSLAQILFASHYKLGFQDKEIRSIDDLNEFIFSPEQNVTTSHSLPDGKICVAKSLIERNPESYKGNHKMPTLIIKLERNQVGDEIERTFTNVEEIML